MRMRKVVMMVLCAVTVFGVSGCFKGEKKQEVPKGVPTQTMQIMDISVGGARCDQFTGSANYECWKEEFQQHGFDLDATLCATAEKMVSPVTNDLADLIASKIKAGNYDKLPGTVKRCVENRVNYFGNRK